MDITTIAHLESLLSSLQTGLANMKAGSPPVVKVRYAAE